MLLNSMHNELHSIVSLSIGIFSQQMAYIYKHSTGKKILGTILRTSQVDSKVNSTQTKSLEEDLDQQQEQNSLPVSTASSYDREKEKLKIIVQERERVIMYLRSALEAVS